jgi:uncharacterized membrane protein YheB (UPF0754 family)
VAHLFQLLQDNPLVLLIPVISAFVGWFTNLVAVRMMFHPTDFVGIKPYLGWQGLVPANAARLARVSTHLITTKLLNLEMLFQSFNAEAFAGGELEKVVEDITDQIIVEVAEKRAAMMWGAMAEDMQAQIKGEIAKEVRVVLTQVVADFADNITDILDLEKVVVDAVVRDRRLLSAMFLEVGEAEFKFIERSGIWFGFLFGLVQMIVWVLYPAGWILPFFGFLVGYATNWIAIKLIFQPRVPKKVGPITIQGLFHKRQREVASKFSDLVANRVLNAENIVRVVSTGDSGDILFGIIEKRIGELIGKYEQHPMAAMLVPADQRDELRAEVLGQVKEDLTKEGGFLYVFAGKSIHIQDELHDRMVELDPESFEGVLRPAFQQDEWKLIVAGAALGLLAGVLQLVYLFGDMIDQLG